MSAEDKEWVMRKGPRQVFWEGRELRVPLPGAGGDADLVAVKTGGHFPGSSVLWFKALRKLLVADSIAVVPSGVYHKDRVPGTASYTFMWSYPNMVCGSCSCLVVGMGWTN
jgi:glyoxylase-like metal-dependent hydrolase (beta-lactamase superfamily II)